MSTDFLINLGEERAQLMAQIRRLEDLRRWRPMSEHPADDRWVLVREVSSYPKDQHTPLPGYYSIRNMWRVYEDGRETDTSNCEWTYIPGQEPEAELK